MTISSTGFLGVWGTATLFWLGLLYQYHSKWNSVVGDVARDIRSYNARNGYDLSVDKEDLARDFLLPFRDQHLMQFAENNKIQFSVYHEELDEAIHKPLFRWGYLFHILGVVYTLSGISYLMPWGFLPASTFLYSIVILFIISLGVYLSR